MYMHSKVFWNAVVITHLKFKISLSGLNTLSKVVWLQCTKQLVLTYMSFHICISQCLLGKVWVPNQVILVNKN